MTMAVKKKFPYRAALVSCGNDCQDGPCTYGCIRCGACAAACKFNAVSLGASGAALVAEDRCTACGACVRACPQRIIRIHECANYIVVKCSNRDKGALARQQCPASCVGCGVCENACTAGAVRVVENLAVINENLCLSCGMCAVKCPRHVLRDLRGILTPLN